MLRSWQTRERVDSTVPSNTQTRGRQILLSSSKNERHTYLNECNKVTGKMQPRKIFQSTTQAQTPRASISLEVHVSLGTRKLLTSQRYDMQHSKRKKNTMENYKVQAFRKGVRFENRIKSHFHLLAQEAHIGQSCTQKNYI